MSLKKSLKADTNLSNDLVVRNKFFQGKRPIEKDIGRKVMTLED